jgi:hypothetical protein
MPFAPSSTPEQPPQNKTAATLPDVRRQVLRQQGMLSPFYCFARIRQVRLFPEREIAMKFKHENRRNKIDFFARLKTLAFIAGTLDGAIIVASLLAILMVLSS